MNSILRTLLNTAVLAPLCFFVVIAAGWGLSDWEFWVFIFLFSFTAEFYVLFKSIFNAPTASETEVES